MIDEKIVDFICLIDQESLGFVADQRTVSGRNVEFFIFVYFYRFHVAIIAQKANIVKY